MSVCTGALYTTGLLFALLVSTLALSTPQQAQSLILDDTCFSEENMADRPALPSSCAIDLLQTRSSWNIDPAESLVSEPDGDTFMVRTWSNGTSLCHDGKVVPRLYVIGGMKCATSSLAVSLRKVGVGAVPDNKAKEWQYIYKTARFTRMSMEQVKHDWMRQLPSCPKSDFQIWGDFSVFTSELVPVPHGLRHHPTMGEDSKPYLNKDAELKWFAPELISYIHGPATRNQLTIALLMREPLARMQSEYYYWMQKKPPIKFLEGACAGCNYHGKHGQSANFSEALKLTIQEARKATPKQVTDWLWRSIYFPTVVEFMRVFDATQLLFIPFHQYVLHQHQTCKKLKERLGFASECWSDDEHILGSMHPSLEKDVDAETIADFNDMIDTENLQLVKHLTEAHAAGSWLAGYDGSVGDEAHVKRWLDASW